MPSLKGGRALKLGHLSEQLKSFFYSYTENDDKENTFVTTAMVKPLF